MDVWIALLELSLATIFAVSLGFHLGRTTHANLLALTLLAIAFLLATTVVGRLEWAHWLPVSAAVIWSRCSTVCLAIVAGIFFTNLRLPRTHRLAGGISLFVTAVFFIAWPVARTWVAPVEIQAISHWQQDVCLQSTEVSCAPSAAVTLLRQYGVASTERELAHVCLTSWVGTEGLGLYRGLNQVGKRGGRRAIVLAGSFSEIANRKPWPAVVLVRFPGGEKSTNIFNRSAFSGREEGHAVVVFGETADGFFVVGDPAFGRDLWTREQLRSRWNEGAIGLK